MITVRNVREASSVVLPAPLPLWSIAVIPAGQAAARIMFTALEVAGSVLIINMFNLTQ